MLTLLNKLFFCSLSRLSIFLMGGRYNSSEELKVVEHPFTFKAYIIITVTDCYCERPTNNINSVSRSKGFSGGFRYGSTGMIKGPSIL